MIRIPTNLTEALQQLESQLSHEDKEEVRLKIPVIPIFLIIILWMARL